MKRLSSRFRPSTHSSHSLHSLYIPAAIAAVVLVMSNCRSRAPDAVNGPTGVSATQPLVLLKDDASSGWIPVRDSADRTGSIIAWLGARSCIDATLKIRSKLNTGIYAADVMIEQDWSQGASQLQIDGVGMSSPVRAVEMDVKEALCAAVREGASPVILPSSISSPFKSGVERVMASVVPDCSNIESTPEGWSCSLRTLMPQAAIIKIEDFQQSMIRRWSRQPYILARRAGITMSLARTATNLAQDGSLHKFCKLLQFSLPEELPLIMTSSRWQKSLCDGTDRQRREAAFHGLAKAVDEIGMLQQLYENTSKVGMFSVRIPESDIPGHAGFGRQPLRVTIVPDAEVSHRLVEIAEVILGRPHVQNRRGRRTASVVDQVVALEPHKSLCWHPMFSDSTALMRVADGMRLTGQGFKGECKVSESELALHTDGSDPLAKYLMQSLTSETEFVIDNGQSKLLRLPEGAYSYSVQALPQNPVDAEESDSESTAETRGDLSWGSVRNHTVRSWQ